MKTINLLAFALLFTFVLSCNTENNNDKQSENKDTLEEVTLLESKIMPSFENLDIEYAKYEMAAHEDFTLKFETGSEVKIPENAFVDENGEAVSGKVEVQYREIVSAAEIIFSGVNMKYEKDGVQYDFQTAGMFDIRAYSNGKPLFLAGGKEIEVTFASNIPGEYDFYAYDETAQNWKETDYGTIEVVEEKTTPNLAFSMPKPVQLDAKNDLVIEVKANYKKFPELAEYKGMMWKYAGDKTKEEITALLSKIWSDSELKPLNPKENLYTLSMITGKKAYELEVMPVFSAAQYKKALEVYEKEKKRTELLSDKQKKVKRTTSVSRLGLHNYDVVHASDRMIVKSDFNIKANQQLLPTESMNFFLITGENDNVVVRYAHNMETSLYFSPSANNKLVAILPGNKVAVLSTKDFAKSVDDLLSKNVTHYSFVLNLLETTINTPSDLDEIIAQL